MAANMYRVGDYVYFEISSTLPYQIRRIEELIKTPNGNVEAKVMCFYRRRDISSSLMTLADKHQSALEEEEELDLESLSEEERHQLNHRELFLSRQVEALPATHIRGKCSVTLLNETESRLSYLNKDDAFFYSLVYDPQQKTLLADRGEIRVGQRYQAEVPQSTLPKPVEDDERKPEDLEELVYNPFHGLQDRQIDQFLIICRSVGTFARALDCSSSVKQPSLHMSAAAASRDITLFHAMDLLHKHKYNITNAIASLVPASGPVLCRDEMEEWSASEANLFEEALEKYGKDFNDIRQDFLPWKSLKNIVEYYYMWKTTDRYVQQKRVKAVEAESKLKQVYIPNYNKSSNLDGSGPGAETPAVGGRPCEGCCATSSSQWYAWGPAHVQCRLCSNCWSFWKKYGGLKLPTPRLESLDLSCGNSSADKISSSSSIHSGSSHRPHRCSATGCGKVNLPNNLHELAMDLTDCRHPSTDPSEEKKNISIHSSEESNQCEFKLKAHLARHCATVHGMAIRSGSPRPIVKTRAAFYLCSTRLTRFARRICRNILKSRRAARNPFQAINVAAIKIECQNKIIEGVVPSFPKLRERERGRIVDISLRLGTPSLPSPEWLVATPKDKIPQPERLAFPPPPRGEDGQFLFMRTPEKEETKFSIHGTLGSASSSILRKRNYEQSGLLSGSTINLDQEFTIGSTFPKRRLMSSSVIKSSVGVTAPDIYSNLGSSLPRGPSSTLSSGLVIARPTTPVNGRAKVATITRIGGRKQMISWVDAPDDVYFVATETTRLVRKHLTIPELRRAARRPTRKLHLRLPFIPPSSTLGMSSRIAGMGNIVSSTLPPSLGGILPPALNLGGSIERVSSQLSDPVVVLD